MNVPMELVLSIGLAITIPLLGVVAACLFVMKSELKTLTKTIESFHEFFEDIRKSLDHNRNEHTQMIALTNATLKEISDSKQDVIERIALTEERIKSDRK